MSVPDEPQEHDAATDATEPDEQDDPVRALVRRALRDAGDRDRAPNLLGGVQRRIRRRSRGRFFADGWSTGQARFGYVLVAAVTMLLVLLAYFGMGPSAVR
jgi:hypothetical protein